MKKLLTKYHLKRDASVCKISISWSGPTHDPVTDLSRRTANWLAERNRGEASTALIIVARER